MRILRTPDARFDNLPDFDYPPQYADVPDGDGGTLRMAYVRHGPEDGPVVLLLHGEPSWSFLYRKMIPLFADAGFLAVAPDLVGFGRSDKPAAPDDHSYARHVEWVRSLVFDALDLRGVTLVGHDWGGLIGMRLVAECPDRFRAVVASNTNLPTGDAGMPDLWRQVRAALEQADPLEISQFVSDGCLGELAPEVSAAYDAPFPDEALKVGPRVFPSLVPTHPDDPASQANRAAWRTLTRLTLPFLVAFSDNDPISNEMGPRLRESIPGAGGRTHPTIADAGHFLQEDAAEAFTAAIIEFVRSL